MAAVVPSTIVRISSSQSRAWVATLAMSWRNPSSRSRSPGLVQVGEVSHHARMMPSAATSSSVHGRGRHRSMGDGRRAAHPAAMPSPVDVPMRARAIAAYDAAADHRDDSALGFLARAADRTIASLELEPGMHVLDVASGTGTAAILAARAVAPGGRVIGIDLSEGMLEAARDKACRAGSRRRPRVPLRRHGRDRPAERLVRRRRVRVRARPRARHDRPGPRAVAAGQARWPARRHDLGAAPVGADDGCLEGRRGRRATGPRPALRPVGARDRHDDGRRDPRRGGHPRGR